MTAWKLLFILSLALFLYNYAGYALLAAILSGLKRRKTHPEPSDDALPTVSFIVCAYNEADCLSAKIDNCLAQDYPAHQVEWIFVTDGSTDAGPDIVRRYSDRVQLLHDDRRQGKSAALHRAVGAATGEVLIFSDANTLLNREAVRRIARHYLQPDTGGVAGEKVVLTPGGAGGGEGLYWKYESALKRIDSRFYSVVGAAGELFSLRRSLYEPVGSSVVLDDFVISLRVAARGYRVIYEPGAVASELPSFSIEEEGKRKVRIAAGGFQAMALLRPLLHFWRHPKLTFLYVSHRVLRWTLSPICLPIAFVANAVLSFSGAGAVYTVLFALQILFYTCVFLGGTVLKEAKPFKLAYYFFFMNWSVYLGFFRYLGGKQSASWEKARRLDMAESPTGA